jgi:ribosome-associated protein
MSEPLIINDTVQIPAAELTWAAARSSGPGGQNVNKVASKVELRFDLPGTRALDGDTKARLRGLVGTRLDADGWVLVISQLTRDQSRNLDDAREKLRLLILRALHRPTPRRPTKVSRSAKARRVADKRQRSTTKQQRSGSTED